MSLDRTSRIVRTATLPAGLELTPQDYFVLSRVDGTPTVRDVLAISGLPAPEAEAIVKRLIAGGALALTAEPEPKRPAASRPGGGDGLRKRAAARRRRALAAQYQGAIAERPKTGEVDAAVETEAETAAVQPGDADSPYIDLPRVAEDDSRLDRTIPIDVAVQRWILALADGVETLSQYEFLGLKPTHDEKLIKRAFHTTSRQLHPDAYYGKELGTVGPLLSDLFRRARVAYSELRDPEVRTPWVDHRIASEAHEARLAQEEQARESAESSLLRDQEEVEAAVRRQQRSAARTERKRKQLRARLADEAKRFRTDADAAFESGNLPRAANLYRLALRASPEDQELRARWEACRSDARKKRGEDAFARATSFLEMGQLNEARPLLIEAAEAHPTAVHLAFAADAVREADASRAREFAMAALDAIGSERAAGEPKRRRRRTMAGLHLKIGRAFLSAGQKRSALEQANIAQEDRPDDPELRALLKACKAK